VFSGFFLPSPHHKQRKKRTKRIDQQCRTTALLSTKPYAPRLLRYSEQTATAAKFRIAVWGSPAKPEPVPFARGPGPAPPRATFPPPNPRRSLGRWGPPPHVFWSYQSSNDIGFPEQHPTLGFSPDGVPGEGDHQKFCCFCPVFVLAMQAVPPITNPESPPGKNARRAPRAHHRSSAAEVPRFPPEHVNLSPASKSAPVPPDNIAPRPLPPCFDGGPPGKKQFPRAPPLYLARRPP